MSGKPNPTEVTALLLNMREMNRLRDAIATRSELIQHQHDMRAKEIAEQTDLWRKSKALIEGMDVHTEGNYGFEGRYHWFILELVRQAAEAGRLDAQTRS